MIEGLHLVCPHCQAINRVPQDRLTQEPNCGQCHRALFDAQPVALTSTTFHRFIIRTDIPVVVDFWASWCGPCKVMAPQFLEAARMLEPHARLAKVDTEAEQSLATQYAIRSIPTLALFVGGKEVARQPGAIGAQEIVQWVRSHL